MCCSVIIVLFYVLIVCTATLPPGVKPIAVDKYIYIYRIFIRRHIPMQATIKTKCSGHITNNIVYATRHTVPSDV